MRDVFFVYDSVIQVAVDCRIVDILLFLAETNDQAMRIHTSNALQGGRQRVESMYCMGMKSQEDTIDEYLWIAW